MKKVLLWCLLAGILAGCHPAKPAEITSQIVTEIIVTCQTCNDFTRRYYNTPKKMQPVLLYLRSVSPGFTPEKDPEPLAGRVICITLRMADGSVKVYRQKDSRYLQEGKNPWKKIDPDWGATLYPLLLENPSDPEPRSCAYQLCPTFPRDWLYRKSIRAVWDKNQL